MLSRPLAERKHAYFIWGSVTQSDSQYLIIYSRVTLRSINTLLNLFPEARGVKSLHKNHSTYSNQLIFGLILNKHCNNLATFTENSVAMPIYVTHRHTPILQGSFYAKHPLIHRLICYLYRYYILVRWLFQPFFTLAVGASS